MVAHACYPRYTRSVKRRTEIQANLAINMRPYPKKITKAKRDWGGAQVVECLLSKYEALNSNPSSET
jgi:hypothetical protein